MCHFWPSEDQGPEGAPGGPAAGGRGGSRGPRGGPWTPRRGPGMPPREPGLESHRPEEEAVMAVKLNPPEGRSGEPSRRVDRGGNTVGVEQEGTPLGE